MPSCFHCGPFVQSSVHRCPPYAERISELRRSHAIRLKLQHSGSINGCRAALVDTGGLGLRDALHLALLSEVRLELSEHALHIQEGLPGRRGGIDRLPVALRLAPLAFTVRTMSCRSPMLRAGRSIRVTISA